MEDVKDKIYFYSFYSFKYKTDLKSPGNNTNNDNNKNKLNIQNDFSLSVLSTNVSLIYVEWFNFIIS
jgi:hypothetical protein